MATRAGIPNKRTQEFREYLRAACTKAGVDPHVWMIEMLKEPKVPYALKFQAAKELAQYLEPKLRSMAITGEDGGPLRLDIRMVNYVDDHDTP